MHGWAPVATLVALGSVVHLVLSANADPTQYDTESFLITADALRDEPLQAYDSGRWPYPPAFFPWLLVATSETVQNVLAFDVLLRLPMLAADIAIALLVYSYLGRRETREATRLVAVGLVMLGPVFLAVSGYHGQIDAVAILPGVAALWFWDRDGPHRALGAGALIGVGIALKTIPGFLLIAVLPWVRSRREVVALLVPAVAIPALLLAPFLFADGADTVEALQANRGIPGFNGVSLILIEPTLVDYWRTSFGVDSPAVANRLADIQPLIIAAVVAAMIPLVALRRVPPAMSASLIWLAIFALNPNFAWHYLVWGLPFFLMAGYVREVFAFQLVALAPLTLFYLPGDLSRPVLDYVYTPLALLAWLALVVAFVLMVRQVLRLPPRRLLSPQPA